MIKKYNEKILLVDDNLKNLQVAMNILKDYNVIFAQSGDKALELLEKNNFDLILLDIVMPKMDGYSVCKEIKKDPRTNKIPIIFLTVKDEERDIVKGFDLGAVDYVTKPFFTDVLRKRVEVHLKLASVMNELKYVNKDLNEKVNEQIIEIRKKDEIINTQKRVSAMSDIINIISSQWKNPLDKLKLYLQLLEFKTSNIKDFDGENILSGSFSEMKKLDNIMSDFHKFFNNKKSKEITNIKVTIDNALFNFKDNFEKHNIKVNISGNNLLSINIVYNELMHIFTQLVEESVTNFCSKQKCEDKDFIDILIDESEESIYLSYEDNSRVYKDEEIDNLFEINEKKQETSFSLGFYLVKLFTEKNKGLILPKATKNGIKYIIRFDK